MDVSENRNNFNYNIDYRQTLCGEKPGYCETFAASVFSATPPPISDTAE